MSDATPAPAASAATPEGAQDELRPLPSKRLNVRALHQRSNSISNLGAGCRSNFGGLHRRQSLKVPSKAPLPLHPDFEYGDAIVVGKGSSLGFRLPSPILKDACNLFVDIATPALSPIQVEAEPHDIHAFLRFITTEPGSLALDVWQVHGVQKILLAWRAKVSIAASLCEYVSTHASRLVGSLGVNPERADLLRFIGVAAEMRCVALWHWALVTLRYTPSWRAALDPTAFSADEVAMIGTPAYEALCFLYTDAAGPWASLDLCTVCRDQTQLFVIMKTAEGRQIMYSDNTL